MENEPAMVSVEHKSVPEYRLCLFLDTGNAGNKNSPKYYPIFHVTDMSDIVIVTQNSVSQSQSKACCYWGAV